MNRWNYKRLKEGPYSSAGIFGEQYAFEILTGICDVPEYYPITKEEFDTYDEWKENYDKVVSEIKNRKLIYSSYRDWSDNNHDV
ncbi:hypothetical protein DMN77_02855 [Paenibacillus sp. 79R4]|uniref:hypothetical protein n=1 Tax=Paenibacillus sp. 79R4 TaxID=2212847 RepID=UPI0015BDCD79|nr:hypothetical protein [Paenibacillus sp. 79R4]NWL86537.1 hypothetical protein [Paenibacillus sp. 79R4]